MALLQTRYLTSKQYTALELRHTLAGIVPREGVVGSFDYALYQRAAGGPALAVDVSPGSAWVQGDDTARQGLYEQVNDAVVTVPIAANGTSNPRIDAIILQVRDSSILGGSDVPSIDPLQGTPTAGATLANLLGKPSIPNTALLLGYVFVGAGAATILNANVGGLYDPGRPTLGADAGAPPQYAFGRPTDRVPTGRIRGGTQAANSGAWQATTLATVDRDNDVMAGGSKLTIKTPGGWAIGGQLTWQGGGGTARGVAVRLNGSLFIASSGGAPPASSTTPDLNCSTVYLLAFGDYLELVNFQDSGGSLNVLGVANSGPVLWAFLSGRGG